eukprot:5572456-Pyramimonas_sp.AAC.1
MGSGVPAVSSHRCSDQVYPPRTFIQPPPPARVNAAGQERHPWNDRGDEASIRDRQASVETFGLIWENKGGAQLIQHEDESKEVGMGGAGGDMSQRSRAHVRRVCGGCARRACMISWADLARVYGVEHVRGSASRAWGS